MSEFDPPKPEDPSPLQMKKDKQARDIENTLREAATKLGMHIRVVADTNAWCFRIYARLLSPSEVYSVDEEMFVVPTKQIGTLLMDILEDLQLKLHDNMAAAMQSRDVRERQYTLSKEDKHTLNDMYRDACDEALRDFASAEHDGRDRVSKYQELMGRLFR